MDDVNEPLPAAAPHLITMVSDGTPERSLVVRRCSCGHPISALTRMRAIAAVSEHLHYAHMSTEMRALPYEFGDVLQ